MALVYDISDFFRLHSILSSDSEFPEKKVTCTFDFMVVIEMDLAFQSQKVQSIFEVIEDIIIHYI